MELKSICTVEAHEEGAEMRVVNPITGEETDFYITVKGFDSKVFRKVSRRKQRALFAALADKDKDKDKELDEEELDAEGLAEATIGWRGLTVNGEEYVFTQERAKDLYKQSPGIRNQLDIFVANRKNFMKG